MRLSLRREVLAFILLLFLALSSSQVHAQNEVYSISSTDVTVFRDGVVLVKERLLVNQTFPTIVVSLLAPSERIGNLIVLDQRGIPLDYELAASNLTIHSLGASGVSLQYETENLTRKQGSVWTIFLVTAFNLTMTLPQQSTVIFLNQPPSEIRANGTSPVLVLDSGRWEISYVLPLPSVTTTTQPTQPPLLPILASPYLLGASGVAGAGLLAYALIRSGRLRLRRGPLESEELRPEEKEVLRFISERGGRVLEAELRVKFLLPKTSMWRLLRRLERRGLVRIRKIGLQNEIELVR